MSIMIPTTPIGWLWLLLVAFVIGFGFASGSFIAGKFWARVFAGRSMPA